MEKRFLEAGYLDAIIGAMGDMVRVITKEGKVAYTNQAFDRKFSGEKITVGERCYDVFGQSDECDACVAREAMVTGRIRQTTRRHANRIFSVAASPVTDERGERFAAVEIFRDMTLDYNIKQNLMSQNAKMQRDLQMARSLQQALVKNVLPDITGYKLYSGFFPCEAVSGDIFDCMVFGSQLVMYVADVSGHGVMPAMLAVFFSRTVRTACTLGYRLPSEIFRYVQEEFRELHLADSIYITGFIVVLDVDRGTFVYSNAGLSVTPVLFDGDIKELYMSAPPVSRWFDEPEFRDDTGYMERGDRLLLYSDGLRDIHGDGKVQDRLYELFSKEDFSCDEFVGNVHGELHLKPEDDLTMLICSRQ